MESQLLEEGGMRHVLSPSPPIFVLQKVEKMRKLEITLTEEQYQHIQEEIKYYSRTHLSEGVFGGFELCLNVSVPNSFGSILEMKTNNIIELGEVEWKFVEIDLRQ